MHVGGCCEQQEEMNMGGAAKDAKSGIVATRRLFVDFLAGLFSTVGRLIPLPNCLFTPGLLLAIQGSMANLTGTFCLVHQTTVGQAL
jgi:hypothetical protein